jgi:iron-sulfur cluster repair protein YtfE (RIC family)
VTSGIEVAMSEVMPTSWAIGTWSSKRVASPAAMEAALPSESELASMSTAARVTGLLVPQHDALRTAVATLRTAAAQLARLEPAHAPTYLRVLAASDELATAMDTAFAREERELYPSMTAGRTAGVAGALHEHHLGFATSLRRLRGLATEVRAAAGMSHDTMIIFAAIATIARLFARHREVEQWVLLGSGPAVRAQTETDGPARRRRAA